MQDRLKEQYRLCYTKTEGRVIALKNEKGKVIDVLKQRKSHHITCV
jgi:hypothetical protein